METLILWILIAIIIAAIYLLWRNNKVYNFRIKIIDDCHNVLNNFLDSLKDDEELHERYEEYKYLETKKDEILSKHSYESMLFSLKPLKLERWYTEEEVKFMNLKFVSKNE